MDARIADAGLRPDYVPGAALGLAGACWVFEQLGAGLEALVRRAELLREGVEGVSGGTGDPAAWIEWAAARLGVEAEPVAFPAMEMERDLLRVGPAVLALHDGSAPVFLLVLGSRRGSLRLIGTDLSIHERPVAVIAAAARARLEGPHEAETARLLDGAGVRAGRRGRVRAAILRERLAAERIGGAWLLRPPASAPFWFQMRHAGLVDRLGWVVALLAGIYGLEIGGWALIGDAALGGRLDLGWLAAWLLLIVSNVPAALGMRWLNAGISLDLARLLKRRLLAGALRTDIDAVRHQGVGQLLGRVMEAHALETLVFSGGLAVLVAAIELVFAAWIMASGAGGALQVLLLVAWLGGTVWLCWRYHRRLRAWSGERTAITHDLIEQMTGHRTRLAQEWPARRDAEDDRAMGRYLRIARAMDGAVVPLGASASGGWKLAGLIGLAPAFVAGGAGPASLAVAVGGMLLANRAFTGIGNGIGSLAQAAVAWGLVADLFRAGGAAEEASPPVPPTAAGARLIDASDLVFRYRRDGEPVLRGLDLTVAAGERVLLEGESGGGKSTLAALLTGLRQPDSGLLLLNGLDRRTLGAAWHGMAAAAPQFHENHVLSGPLAFNLLMGRGWPASATDLAEARAVCEELGLGPLLDRMPAGLMQQVGETGWQLSHGERGRIFLARALLQEAELTILDESFAALDPETLKLCMDCARRRAKTLMVIAHP
jgi:ATP-binding cassette subfamily B protein